MCSMKPDGYSGRKAEVRLKQRSHVIVWKETLFKEEDMLHFVLFGSAVEALLCSCKVVTGTTPGKETRIFKCTEHEYCRNLWVKNNKQRHRRVLLCVCALVFIKVICSDLQ